MTDIPKVEQINIVLGYGTSAWAYGFYIVEDDTVTMVNQDGTPLSDPLGKPYAQKLDGESPRTIAARMVRAIELARKPMSNFNRPLNYPPLGLA